MANKTMVNLNKLSRLFQPMIHDLPNTKDKIDISKSHRLMINQGIIKPVNSGMFAFLPLGIRVLNKLINLVDNEMATIDAQKIILPALISTALWEKTNRYNSNEGELFTVIDRHNKSYILSPTHEEAICDLISSIGSFTSKLLPLKLYQISSKWRDEMKPRLGLLRSREFIMKDLYTFDISLDHAQNTYDLVCQSYDNIFKKIGIQYTKVIGDVGTIGGLVSHEYHYLSDIGEDIILNCPLCQFHINQVVSKTTVCHNCKQELHQHKAAEVGHTFLLNTKYSQPLKAMYMEQNELKPMVMGCFGLGLSRIIALAIEILSTENEIRWPQKLAPYTVCIIPPKAGSKEENASVYVEQLYEIFDKLNIDMIVDDRTNLTIGKRLMYARKLGYPFIVVLGKSAIQSVPLFEIHNLNESVYQEFSLEQINNYFNEVNLKIK